MTRPAGTSGLEELTRAAVSAARAGARVAASWQAATAERGVREKTGPRDLVSEADLQTETAIRQVLSDLRPDDAVLGEEFGQIEGHTGVRWVVDPIDGTTSFLYGRADWSVSVAALDDDGVILTGVVAEPAHDRVSRATLGAGAHQDDRPMSIASRTDLAQALVEVNFGRPDQHPLAGRMVDALLPAVRDLRRGGSAASSLAAVASGRADAVWSPGLHSWDAVAGMLLVQEAGGVVGDLTGPSHGRWPGSGNVLAASPELFEPLRRLLASVYLG